MSLSSLEFSYPPGHGAALFRESELAQPPVDEETAKIRTAVSDLCFNSARISPESLIHRALEGFIGCLDLFTYHREALTPRAAIYAETHPNEKVVYIGLEFNGEGKQKENEFLINYDALEFLKRTPDNIVRFVNIDFPNLGSQTFEFLAHIYRILTANGSTSWYASKEITDNQIVNQLKMIGFQNISFPPIKGELDLIKRKPYLLGVTRRILAEKE